MHIYTSLSKAIWNRRFLPSSAYSSLLCLSSSSRPLWAKLRVFLKNFLIPPHISLNWYSCISHRCLPLCGTASHPSLPLLPCPTLPGLLLSFSSSLLLLLFFFFPSPLMPFWMPISMYWPNYDGTNRHHVHACLRIDKLQLVFHYCDVRLRDEVLAWY